MSAADKYVEEIREGLFALKDEKYKEFHKKLIPTVDENTVIGVRTPALRKYAKEVSGAPGAEVFMPNDKTHPEFGEALRHAAENGVKVLAYECNVTEDSMEISVPCRVSRAG